MPLVLTWTIRVNIIHLTVLYPMHPYALPGDQYCCNLLYAKLGRWSLLILATQKLSGSHWTKPITLLYVLNHLKEQPTEHIL
jgi:hypothetical protein